MTRVESSPGYDLLSRKPFEVGDHVAAYAGRYNFGPPSICSNGPFGIDQQCKFELIDDVPKVNIQDV